MGISLDIIKKSVFAKFFPKRKNSRYPALSWLQEKRLKHEDHNSVKMLKMGDLRLYYRRPYEVLHTYKELFEQEIYNFRSSNESPFIIDCGANIGLSTLYFKYLFPKAKVIAFEPDQKNFELLGRNIQLNSLQDIECRQSAVWIHNDWLSFTADGTQSSTIASEPSNKNTVQVKSERLADILSKKKVDFLKIDIEGAELAVIKDCAPFFANVENLFVEYHGKVDESNKLSELLSLLDTNFQVYIKIAADNLLHPFVQKGTGGSFDVQLNIFCYRSK